MFPLLVKGVPFSVLECVESDSLRLATWQRNKGTEESTLGKDFSVPLMHHDSSDLELISLVKKRKISFWI